MKKKGMLKVDKWYPQKIEDKIQIFLTKMILLVFAHYSRGLLGNSRFRKFLYFN